jgi:RNA polymerase sigma factor (sigma-70 family)
MGDGKIQPLIHRLMHTIGADGGLLTDSQLLDRFVLAKDEAAFESLLWRHGSMVMGLCQRILRHRHDAEDAFQAVFLVFFRKANSINRKQSVASWLYKVAYRIAVKARSRAAHPRREEFQFESLHAPTEPDVFLASDRKAVLDDSLSRLPERYRIPLVLHYLEGKTVQQTAEEIGCPCGTVSGRLNRGKELLRQSMARRGVALSGALVPAVLERAGSTATMRALLAAATVQAVQSTGDHATVTASVSPGALALADSATRRLARWKIATALVLMIGFAVVSVGLARQQIPPPASPPAIAAATPVNEDASAPKPVIPTRDEDPLPQGARLRLGSQRFTFGAFIESLALSPDGATVAALGPTNSVLFWDAATGKLQTTISANDLPVQVTAVEFSPDGAAVAVGDSKGRAVVIASWRKNNEPATGVDEHHNGSVKAVRFAPDGQTVASAGVDGIVRVWLRATGQVLHTLDDHCGPINALAFAPDGKTLAAAGQDSTIRLWDPTTGMLRKTCKGHKGSVRALAFSTDGKVLASAGEDRRVLLWSPDTDDAVRDYNLRTAIPLALAFVDQKRLVVGSEAGGLRLFDIAANKLLRDYRGLAWAVNVVACSQDGRWLVAGGQDGVFRRWDLESGKLDEHDLPGHRGPVWCMDLSLDGRVIATGGLDGTVRLWDSASGKALETYQPDWQTPRGLSYVSAVAIVGGGRVVAAAGGDGEIHLRDRQESSQAHWTAHRGKVTAMVGCRGGDSLVSAGSDGAVHLWRTSTHEKVLTYEGVHEEIRTLAVSRDGERLAGVEANGAVHLWELATGRLLATLAAKGSGLNVVAFSPVAAVLGSSGLAAPLHQWRLGQDGPPEKWQSEDSKSGAIAFGPDGTLAIAGRDNIIRLWNVNGPTEVGRFSGHQTRINAVLFAPDGKSLMSASDDGTVLVWEMAPNRPRTNVR